jgi:hypothetical protein
MKLSEVLAKLGQDEYFQTDALVFIYKKKNNGSDILMHVIKVEDDMRVISRPPSGNNKVTNIYWDPTMGKVAVEYDNTTI